MALRLNGSSSGYVELEVPADAGSHTLTLPDGGGTSGQYLQTNGSGALSWQTVDTGAAWGSGTSTDLATGSSSLTFSSIPSTARIIYVVLDTVSWDTSTGYLAFRLGTGGSDVTSGYHSTSVYLAQAAAVSVNGTITDSLRVNIWQSNASDINGIVKFVNRSGNSWCCDGIFTNDGENSIVISGATVDVGGTLDQITMYQTNGEDWDNGTVQIHYITD